MTVMTRLFFVCSERGSGQEGNLGSTGACGARQPPGGCCEHARPDVQRLCVLREPLRLRAEPQGGAL